MFRYTTCSLILYFQDDISGDYRDAILALVVGGDPPDMQSKCESPHLVSFNVLLLRRYNQSANKYISPKPESIIWLVSRLEINYNKPDWSMEFFWII